MFPGFSIPRLYATHRIGAIVGGIQSAADGAWYGGKCGPTKCRHRQTASHADVRRGERGRERASVFVRRNGNGDREKGEETADRSLSMRGNLAVSTRCNSTSSWKIPNDERIFGERERDESMSTTREEGRERARVCVRYVVG